jgi:hypothetical protein
MAAITLEEKNKNLERWPLKIPRVKPMPAYAIAGLMAFGGRAGAAT